ncbi:hypothetical protein DINM_006411 [Dirofilaria immitis]|nr:hypothetical protein [Dirofilaria immitis]
MGDAFKSELYYINSYQVCSCPRLEFPNNLCLEKRFLFITTHPNGGEQANIIPGPLIKVINGGAHADNIEPSIYEATLSMDAIVAVAYSSLFIFCRFQKTAQCIFGTYTLEKSINLDEYLTARGYKWLTRRLILIASVTKIIRKAASGLSLRYDMETLTWKKNVIYTDFALGTSFLTHHLEDGLFNVTIDTSQDGAVMTENVIHTENSEDHETFHYTREGNYLIMRTTWKGVNAAGFYRKACSYDINNHPEFC